MDDILHAKNKTVTVRGLTIGCGRPKLCVPMTGSSQAQLMAEAAALLQAGAQMAEWRMDWFSQVQRPQDAVQTLLRLREMLGSLPLLATFRTQGEGGHAPISLQQYEALYEAVIESGQADLVDFEFFLEEETVDRLMHKASAAGVRVVLSSHDFQSTPEAEVIRQRLLRMRQRGADIVKIAVMPRCASDVAELLKAAAQSAEALDCPLIAMSMSKIGAVSRIAGQVFGSAVTFGTAGRASAPGQIPAAQLLEALSLVERLLFCESQQERK